MMARKSGEVGRGFAWRGCAAGGALGALALAAVFLVAGSRGGATELAAFPPEKAAAIGRIEVRAPRRRAVLQRLRPVAESMLAATAAHSQTLCMVTSGLLGAVTGTGTSRHERAGESKDGRAVGAPEAGRGSKGCEPGRG